MIYNTNVAKMTQYEARRWDVRVRDGPNDFFAWRHVQAEDPVVPTTKIKRDLEELQEQFRRIPPESNQHKAMHRQVMRIFTQATGRPVIEFTGETAARWIETAILRETKGGELVLTPCWDTLVHHQLQQRPKQTIEQIEVLTPIYNRAYGGSGLLKEVDAKQFVKDLKAAHRNLFA